MIETIATVVACSQGKVTLQASQKSSCDHCSEPECGSGQVNRALGKRLHRVTLAYADKLAVGTQVVLALPEEGLITAAGLMFGLPLFTLLFGACIGELLFEHELITLTVALIGGWLGYKLANFWHRNIDRRASLEPKIIKVLACEEIKVNEVS